MLLNRSIGSSLRSKDSPSNFNFLMQSMQRDKENHNLNLTASTATLDFAEKTSKREPRKMCSLMEESVQLPRHSLCIPQNPSTSFDVEQLLRKIENYLAITEQLLQLDRNGSSSLKAQLTRIGEQISSQVEAYRRDSQPHTSPFFNNVSLRKSLNMRGFQSTIKREENNYLKRIKELEGEVERQNEKINQHKNANIKMFIKKNEQESSEIEQYKAQLEKYYKDYKQLEAKVKDYQQRVKVLERDKLSLQTESQNKKKVIDYLEQKLSAKQKEVGDGDTIKQLQQTIDQQTKQIETLYSNMKQIVGKFEQKELAYHQQLERLGKKSRPADKPARKVSQATQVNKPARTNLDHELFSYMLLQANSIEEFLNK